jgi:hypothetical protein
MKEILTSLLIAFTVCIWGFLVILNYVYGIRIAMYGHEVKDQFTLWSFMIVCIVSVSTVFLILKRKELYSKFLEGYRKAF